VRDLLLIAAAILGAMAVVVASVGLGGDTSTFVSPPEVVVEQFVRKLATGRYDVALAHLDEDSPAVRERIQTTSDQLRARTGAIEQVEGQPGAIDGDRATATAVVTTERAGEITMWFPLVRRFGSWRITDF
jgi:hypothetical protein